MRIDTNLLNSIQQNLARFDHPIRLQGVSGTVLIHNIGGYAVGNLAGRVIRTLTPAQTPSLRHTPLNPPLNPSRDMLGTGPDFSQQINQLLNRTFEESQANSKGVAAAKSIRDNLPEGNSSENDNCSICFENFDIQASRKVVKLECNHHFHKECVLPWLESNNSCPNCRHLMESNDPEWNRANSKKLEQAKKALNERKNPDSSTKLV